MSPVAVGQDPAPPGRVRCALGDLPPHPTEVLTTPGAIDLLSIARRRERIADPSTNIAEDVIFLMRGRWCATPAADRNVRKDRGWLRWAPRAPVAGHGKSD